MQFRVHSLGTLWASMEVVADGEPGQGPQEQCLYGDILGTILSHADGYALGRVLAVCSEWRAQGTDDSLWRRMCFGRWNLVARSHGRYKYGERSWYEVYRIFHRRQRLPRLPSISDRDVVYASGRQHRLCCSLLVSHQPACRLARRPLKDGGLGPVLLGRLLLQNLRDTPVSIDAMQRGLVLTFRDGERTSGKLQLHNVGGEGAADVSEWSQPGNTAGSAPPLGPLLAPLQTAVIDVEFPMRPSMAFEPDALEACYMLRVGATCASGAHVSVDARFAAEDHIWKHYEVINSGFMVHNVSDE